jgi:hypothetical protein
MSGLDVVHRNAFLGFHFSQSTLEVPLQALKLVSIFYPRQGGQHLSEATLGPWVTFYRAIDPEPARREPHSTIYGVSESRSPLRTSDYLR